MTRHWLWRLPLAAWMLLAAGAPALAAEPSAAPQLRIEAGMHTGVIRGVATDAAGRWAVTAGDDKSVRVWELASGRLERVLRPPIGPGNEGKLYAVAMAPDGATVAAAGFTGFSWEGDLHVALFDRASGRLLRRLGGLPNAVTELAFSPDGRWLAATLKGANGVRVWDWRQHAPPLAGGAGADSIGAGWSHDGRLLVSSYDGKLRIYRVAPGRLDKLAEAPAPGGERPFGVAFAPDGRSVAVGYYDGRRVDVLDAAGLELLHSPDVQGGAPAADPGRLNVVAWSRDGRTLAAAGGNGRVLRWGAAGRGAPVLATIGVNIVAQLVALPDGAWLAATADPSWGVLGAQGRWQARGAAPVADLRASPGPALPLLAADARALQFGFERGGAQPHRFDLRSRTLAAGTLAGALGARVTGLELADWANGTAPKLAGRVRARAQPGDRRRRQQFPARQRVARAPLLKRRRRALEHAGARRGLGRQHRAGRQAVRGGLSRRHAALAQDERRARAARIFSARRPQALGAVDPVRLLRRVRRRRGPDRLAPEPGPRPGRRFFPGQPISRALQPARHHRPRARHAR
ncbi:MAG: hypothetical protein V4857_11215 [Pseudomonadota bacterium]